MGSSLFESNPILRGRTNNLSLEQLKYFNRAKEIMRNNYINNFYSDYNLKVSLEQKSFEDSQRTEPIIEDISWIDYIYRQLDVISNVNEGITWTTDLANLLSKEIFTSENEFYSDFFYNEYYFQTSKGLDDDSINDNNEDFDDKRLMDLNIDNNNNNELDVTDYFGGSFMEINLNNFKSDPPTYKYYMKRKYLKKHIKIFKKHIFSNKHPINRVVDLFTRSFCRYIKTKMLNYNNSLKGQKLVGDAYEKEIKDFEKEITNSLRCFIMTIHTSLKLFYSTCIDYSCFNEEKDDLINLVTSLVFKTGTIYESIYNLYLQSFNHDVEVLQEKLSHLRTLRPKELEVKPKFCLDEDTLELQRTILNDKQKEKDKKENEKEKIENRKSEEKNKREENDLFQIKESEEEKYNEENEKSSINNIDNDNLKENNDINTNTNKEKQENNNNKDSYLLENFNDEMAIENKEAVYNGFLHLRNTINSFNKKKYLFPKIKNNLRDTLALNDKYIREVIDSGKLPLPFNSAIKLIRNIKNYKTPFEKVIILAAISDQITESVTNFWKSMVPYIKDTFLNIEAEELQAIFLYITIKSQMPELFVELKIISNFTTPNTRAFTICYNCIVMEASLEIISKMDITKEIGNREKQLKDLRKSIAVLTTQRLSRISRLSNPVN